METKITFEEIGGLVGTFLRATPEATTDQYTYKVGAPDNMASLTLLRADFQSIKAELESMELAEVTSLVGPRYIEMPVNVGFGYRLHIQRNPTFQVNDNESSISYEVTAPSPAYVVLLMQNLSQRDLQTLGRLYMGRNTALRHLELTSSTNLLEQVASLITRILTLKIRFPENVAEKHAFELASSYLFNITYNLDVSMVQIRSFDEMTRSSRIRSVRRGDASKLEPPRRRYQPDLLHHYQAAVAAESPAHIYLSFYHVAEHFFERVFNDDLISRVREKMTKPDFSYKRSQDIRKLIELVGKALKYREESMVFSEPEALRLTLSRFVALDELRAQVSQYDETLIDYYRSATVEFCDGDKVDLTAQDSNSVFKTLSERIYKTRNAIVHSKESERKKYIPFKHDASLSRELPLIRFVAEQVLIGSSETLS